MTMTRTMMSVDDTTPVPTTVGGAAGGGAAGVGDGGGGIWLMVRISTPVTVTPSNLVKRFGSLLSSALSVACSAAAPPAGATTTNWTCTPLAESASRPI